MASETRLANTDDERDLCDAAEKGDVKRLTSLLQKGVDPNVYKVWWHEKKREREKQGSEVGRGEGEMREREIWQFFSFFLLI